MTGQATRKLYFLGELGVFVQFALGAFERYFDRFPQSKIDILTFSDFGKLLSHLFPDNIVVTPYDGPPLGAHRCGIGLVGKYPKEIDQIVAGREDFSGLAAEIGVRRPLYFARQRIPNEALLRGAVRRVRSFFYNRVQRGGTPYFPIFSIRQPITVEPRTRDQRNILILPRLRHVPGGEDRNVETDFWNDLIRDHLTPAFGGRVPIYVCGLPAERVAGLANEDLCVPIGDLLEEVRLLNDSSLLICPLSGYGQLASFAGADVLYVLPRSPVAEEDRHIASLRQSNIFGRTVHFVRQDDLLASPDIAISHIEAALSGPPAETPTEVTQ